MRYNDRVEIITKQEEYDPETGEYTSSEDKAFCSSSCYGFGYRQTSRSFGEYKRGSKSGLFPKCTLKSHSLISFYRKERYKVPGQTKQSGRVFY